MDKNYITPYFLSCRRLNLFKETFESFWDTCDDKDLIKSFIVIDDNSENNDRFEIQKIISKINIPNIFIAKNDIRGQASSLNIVYNICKTKYAIAIEDDWKFIRSGNYVRESIGIMDQFNNIKRVCLDLSTSGKSINEISEKDIYQINNEKFYINEYKIKNEWPSFTFRQCIIDIESCFKNIGYVSHHPELSHDGSRPTAETDYAVRYCNYGYRTAFFLDTFVKEISKNISSSFDLNGVSRYKEYDY